MENGAPCIQSCVYLQSALHMCGFPAMGLTFRQHRFELCESLRKSVYTWARAL